MFRICRKTPLLQQFHWNALRVIGYIGLYKDKETGKAVETFGSGLRKDTASAEWKKPIKSLCGEGMEQNGFFGVEPAAYKAAG